MKERGRRLGLVQTGPRMRAEIGGWEDEWHTLSIPAHPPDQLHDIQNVVPLAYRRKRRNRRPGRKPLWNDTHTYHTPSIPAHPAGMLH